MSEKFELELDINDSVIDDGIRKLQNYERLVKRVSSTVRQSARNVAPSGRGGSVSGGTGGLGELAGTLGGASVVERLAQNRRDKKELDTGLKSGVNAGDKISQAQNRRFQQNQSDFRMVNRPGISPLSNIGSFSGAQAADRAQSKIRDRIVNRSRKQILLDNLRASTKPPSILKQQAGGFFSTRSEQLVEGLANGGFSARGFGRSATAGINRRVGSVIGSGIGSVLGSIIPGAGTIGGLLIGAAIGGLADRAVEALMSSSEDEDPKKVTLSRRREELAQFVDNRLRNPRNRDSVAAYIQEMSTRDLMNRNLRREQLREGESGFTFFGDFFGKDGYGFVGPGWSSRNFDLAEEQQARELLNRRTGGKNKLDEMRVNLIEEQIFRMTRE